MFLILAINTKFLVFRNMSYFFCQKKILKFDFLSPFCPVLTKNSSKSQFLSYFDLKIIGNLFIPHFFLYGIYIPHVPKFYYSFPGNQSCLRLVYFICGPPRSGIGTYEFTLVRSSVRSSVRPFFRTRSQNPFIGLFWFLA